MCTENFCNKWGHFDEQTTAYFCRQSEVYLATYCQNIFPATAFPVHTNHAKKELNPNPSQQVFFKRVNTRLRSSKAC